MQRFTAHNTPQHNGIAERLNHMILEQVCALLHASGLLKYLWGEVACHVIWLKNQTPTKVLNGLTPFEVAFGTKPDLSHVREWGSKVFVRVEGISKLSGCVETCRWMGIDDKSENACCVYWPAKQSVIVECNVSWLPTHHVLKGEHDDTQVPDVTIAYIPPHPPLTSPPATTNVSSPASAPPLSSSIPDPHPQCTHRPSQCVLDILQGKATDLLPTRGIQLPTSIPETADHNPASFEGEQPTQPVPMVTDYDNDVELVLNLNEVIANAEALEPTSIAEA